MFRPQVNQRLRIGRHVYRFLPHPVSPAFPYGQEGRMAVVYKLLRETQGTSSSAEVHRAFKVFKSAYRTPKIEVKARELKPFASLPGLQVCARRVISPHNPQYHDLLQQYPDLAYAVLMPWVPGETWGDIMLRQRPLPRPQAWALAWAVLYVLAELEKRHMAHCDVAAANLMVHWHDHQPVVALVDVEQLYAPNLSPPDALLVGSPGYMPRFDRESLWSPLGDRFAGAVLLAEILGWYHPEVVQHGNEQSYFREEELHTESDRFRALVQALEAWAPVFGELFRRAWFASSLQECPPFALWYDAFQGKPVDLRGLQPAAAPAPPPGPGPEASPVVEEAEPEGPGPSDMEGEDEGAGEEPGRAEARLEEPHEGVVPASSSPPKGEEAPPLDLAPGFLESGPTEILVETEEEFTQMVGLEAATSEMSVSTPPESAPPEERLQALWWKARKHLQLGLADQALTYYRQAIEICIDHRLPHLETLLHEYNGLIFQQIQALQYGIYRHAALERTRVHSMSAVQRLGYWLGGLNRTQLVMVLGVAAVGALSLMLLLSPLVHHPFWASLSLGTFLLAILLPAFQRPPVVAGIFVVSVLFGLVGISISGSAQPDIFFPLLIAALGSWLAAWGPEALGWRLPKDWLPHMLWSVGTAVWVGMLIDEVAYLGTLGKFNNLMAWIFNPLLAFTGWFVGYHLRELLLAFREASIRGEA